MVLVVNALGSFLPVDPLPYTFPPDIVPPSPYIPPQPPQPPIPPKPYIPPTPPLPPGPGPGPSEPKTQLQRDINYVRGTVGYNPTPDPVTNSTTPKPEMPGWEIDTSIIEQILLAATLIAGSLIFAILSQREAKLPAWGQYEERTFGNWAYSDLIDAVLLALSIVAFITFPEVASAILMFYAALAPFVEIIYFANKTGFMVIFTLVLLFLSFYFILKKIQEGKLKNSMLFDLLDELGKKFGKK